MKKKVTPTSKKKQQPAPTAKNAPFGGKAGASKARQTQRSTAIGRRFAEQM